MLTCLVAGKLRIWVPASVIAAATAVPTASAAEPLCKLAVETGLCMLWRQEAGKVQMKVSWQAC